MKIQLFASALLLCSASLFAKDPTATLYDWSQCTGSHRPYPVPTHAVDYPDSLTPVMINHVGRHGARFAASPRDFTTLQGALQAAANQKTITPAGRSLMKIVSDVMAISDGRWGAIDSLGIAEQRGIASRMYANFPALFKDADIKAISSYSPRCIMSMYEFTHQISRLDNSVQIATLSGRINSPLLRFFDSDADYLEFRKSAALDEAVSEFFKTVVPKTPLQRVLGYTPENDDDAIALVMAEYSVLAGLDAISYPVDVTKFFTREEYNALWNASNFRLYARYSASVLSKLPSDIASPLLLDIVGSIDSKIADPEASPNVMLRFGHAETLAPLVALMHLPGCYYLTNYYDTVALHWKDFDIVPMAANLQIILFRADSGEYYIRTDINEVPTTLIPADKSVYVPWTKARAYLERCIPLYY